VQYPLLKQSFGTWMKDTRSPAGSNVIPQCFIISLLSSAVLMQIANIIVMYGFPRGVHWGYYWKYCFNTVSQLISEMHIF
jgi:hypothetical protein